MHTSRRRNAIGAIDTSAAPRSIRFNNLVVESKAPRAYLTKSVGRQSNLFAPGVCICSWSLVWRCFQPGRENIWRGPRDDDLSSAAAPPIPQRHTKEKETRPFLRRPGNEQSTDIGSKKTISSALYSMALLIETNFEREGEKIKLNFVGFFRKLFLFFVSHCFVCS